MTLDREALKEVLGVEVNENLEKQVRALDARSRIGKDLTSLLETFMHCSPTPEEFVAFQHRVLELQNFVTKGEGDLPPAPVAVPKVALTLPFIYQVEDSSRRAAYLYASEMKYRVSAMPSLSSALCYGLNRPWAMMENDPEPFDYWAILHADVDPGIFWLDKCIERLERGGYDVMNACSAIKDDRGLTSTGFGSIQDDDYFIRRITMTELHELPETFDISHVIAQIGLDGFPAEKRPVALFPNTAVLVVKLKGDDGKYKPWVKKFPGFQMKDWIDRSEGVAVARNVPEDWFFGQWAGKNGLRVGATREPSVEHFGSKNYTTRCPWGIQKTDESFVNASRRLQEAQR